MHFGSNKQSPEMHFGPNNIEFGWLFVLVGKPQVATSGKIKVVQNGLKHILVLEFLKSSEICKILQMATITNQLTRQRTVRTNALARQTIVTR